MSTNKIETWLQVDDCKLRVITFENKADTPVLVMLHGGPGSGADPLIELSAFQKLNDIFTTVYFDQRGTGKSHYDLSKQVTKQQAAKDVHAVVDWARKSYPNRAVYLWGASYGGLLSLLFLDMYPNDVDKSVICSAAVLLPSEMKATMENARTDLKCRANQLPKELQDIFSSTTVSDTLEQNDALDSLLSNMDELPKGFEGIFYTYAMRSWFLDYDARPVLAKIQIPTLIIHGENDPICPISTIKNAYEKASNKLISFVPFANCGHATFDDCEDRFVKEISNFLLEK